VPSFYAKGEVGKSVFETEVLFFLPVVEKGGSGGYFLVGKKGGELSFSFYYLPGKRGASCVLGGKRRGGALPIRCPAPFLEEREADVLDSRGGEGGEKGCLQGGSRLCSWCQRADLSVWFSRCRRERRGGRRGREVMRVVVESS